MVGAINGSVNDKTGLIETTFAPIPDPVNPQDPANMRWVQAQVSVNSFSFENFLTYVDQMDSD